MYRPVNHPHASPVLVHRSVALLVGALSLIAVAPSIAAAATPAPAKDGRVIIRTTPAKSSDRIAAMRRQLPPTVVGKRAIGAVYQDRVDVAFEVVAGDIALGLVKGVVDLATSNADLQYVSPPAGPDSVATGPFSLRIRNGRIQVLFPPALRVTEGVDGYVTTIDEGSYAGVGTENEVLLPIAILTGLALPSAVDRWSVAKPSGNASSDAKATAGATKSAAASSTKESTSVTAVPAVTGTVLTGTAKRTQFSLFPAARFGSAAGVDLRLNAGGQMKSIIIRFSPVPKAKKDGTKVIELRGTIKRSTRELAAKAPQGNFVTAAKYFNLDPLPELSSSPDTAAV